MWGWLGDHAWVGWASLGLLLAVAELLSLDLVLLMLAAGAFAGALAAALGADFLIALLVAIATASALLVLVRPSIVRRMRAGPELTTGYEALVGSSGVVLATVTEHGGEVKLAGEVWTARCFEPNTVIEPGTKVAVFAIDGATAVVYPND
jgi:membrane protein implicated in regulation of membrane protease activity